MSLTANRCRRYIGLMMLLLAAAPAAAVDLKIATLAPDGTQWMLDMRKGAEEVAQRTAGRVNIKFYPGGSMGSDRNVLRKIRAGQLHGGALTGGSLNEIHPDTQLYSLPFVFQSYDEVDYVRARMDKTIAGKIEERGYVTFGFSDGGFAYLMSSLPIRKVDDLRNQKVWIPEGDDISRLMLEKLGVSPIPLPLTDVLTGLQTGMVTTLGTSAIGAIAFQWHTRIHHAADTPALYLYGTLMLDKKSFGRLDQKDQAVVREVMERVSAGLSRQTRLDDRNAYDALHKQGVRFTALAPEELNKLRVASDQTIEQLGRQGSVSPALLKTLQDHIDTYRRQHTAAVKH
jgi:TRAP-type C4-dicarboxylate transport system substrate-binding protein